MPRSEHAPAAIVEAMSVKHSEQAKTLVIGRALATLGESLIPLVIVRLLGKADVGDLAAALAIQHMVGVICGLGMGNAVMYFIPGKSPGARRALAYRHLWILGQLGAVAGAIALVIGLLSVAGQGALRSSFDMLGGGKPVSLVYLCGLALLPIVDLPARVTPNLFIVEQRATLAANAAIAKSLGMTAATLIPAALGLSVWWVVGSMVVFGWVYFAGLVLALRHVYAGRPVERADVSSREILRFALPLGATDMVSILTGRLDTLLVVTFLSTTAVAEYQTGAFQIPFLTTIAYSVGAVYTPAFREHFSAGEPREALKLWRTSAEKVSLLVVPVSLIFFVAAPDVIALLFTEEYLAAVPVFRCYLVLTVARVTTFGNVLVAAGKPRWVFHCAALTLGTHVLLSVPLLFAFGFVGPALGAALTVWPSVLYYCGYIARASGVRLRETFPWLHYATTFAVAAVAGLAAWQCTRLVEGNELVDRLSRLGIATVVQIGGFLLLAGLLGLVKRSDLRFLLKRRGGADTLPSG